MPHHPRFDFLDETRLIADLYFYSLDDRILEVQVLEPRPLSPIPESIVQTLWRTQQFHHENLRTMQGESVEIVHPGRQNLDSGPDFLDARIVIGGIDWRGDVEIHITSRAWNDHKHDRDSRYNSTILHCTLFSDFWTSSLKREDGSMLPEIVLLPYLKESLSALLRVVSAPEPEPLPCRPLLPLTSTTNRRSVIEEQAAERLRHKKRQVEAAYLQTPDLDALLHRLIFAGLGYAKNAEAMYELASRIPLHTVQAIHDIVDLEALHFGVAGLIPSTRDLLGMDRPTADYVSELQYRYERLQIKYQIPPMPAHAWHFFRLRPANFPTLRIAQGIALLASESLFRRGVLGTLEKAVISNAPLNSLKALFAVPPSKFWNTHYRFKNSTANRDPQIGENRVYRLLINAVAPVLLVHADQTNQLALEERTIGVLKSMPAESDHLVTLFKAAGFTTPNAYISQGVHQLHRAFCVEKRCLECKIGRSILNEAQ